MALSSALIESLRTLYGATSPTLIDVGASQGIHSRWSQFGDLLKVVGFEPNPDEFRKLPPSSQIRWIQAAVAGESGERTLYVTRFFDNCSLLRPNMALLKELEWANDHDVMREEQVKCVSLDTVLAEHGATADFLKVDTQGTELEILRGGLRLLDSELVQIEVEVEFCQLYENQPLFADVDAELRSRGFYLHDLANHLFVKPRGMGHIGGPKSRVISANAVYFREPAALMEWSDAKVGSTIVAYIAYGFPEAALHLLNYCKSHGRSIANTDILSRCLLELRHSSHWLNWLPGREFLTRCAKRVHLDFRPVRNALWESELGNRLS